MRAEMDPLGASCPVGLRACERLLEVDRGPRLPHQARLRELGRAHSGEIRIFSAHDAREFGRLAGERQSIRAPAAQLAPAETTMVEGDEAGRQRQRKAPGTSFRPPKGRREAGGAPRRIVRTGAAGPAPAELNPGSSSTASVATASETDEGK
jgi:hypothetical protein